MRRAVAVAGAFAMLLAATSAVAQSGRGAPADDGCDPRVQSALEDSAVAGVERDIRIIRDPEEGIGDPDSLFDLSCDLFDFPSWDTLVSLPTLPDLMDILCDAAKDVWRREVLRPFDRSIYALDRKLDVLPGLGVKSTRTQPPVGPQRPAERRPWRNPDERPSSRPADVLRGIVGGEDT
ncbi:MAG: hypothetical protein OXH14_00100 [Alphaproteobacteria bacterium]|nr:hypothetical protein [Alphaproteobacteria bacterium]